MLEQCVPSEPEMATGDAVDDRASSPQRLEIILADQVEQPRRELSEVRLCADDAAPRQVSLEEKRQELMSLCEGDIQALQDRFGLHALQLLEDEPTVSINYPVVEFPTKVSAHNFDKNPLVEGKLMGIKGQYLLLDTGVLNIRKFGGYHIELETR